MIESGCERVSTERPRRWRWWFVAVADTLGPRGELIPIPFGPTPGIGSGS